MQLGLPKVGFIWFIMLLFYNFYVFGLMYFLHAIDSFLYTIVVIKSANAFGFYVN